jgi:hypothetical protein
VIPEAGPSSCRDEDLPEPHDGDDVACDVAESWMRPMVTKAVRCNGRHCV